MEFFSSSCLQTVKKLLKLGYKNYEYFHKGGNIFISFQ